MKKIYKIFIISLLLINSYNLLFGNSRKFLFNKPDYIDTSIINTYIDNAFELSYINPDSAFFYVNKAIEKSDKISYKKGLGDACQTKGIIYYSIDKYDSAIYFFNEAVIYREFLNDSIGIASAYNNIALAYSNLDEYKKSVYYNLKALSIRENLKDSINIGKSLNNLGLCYHLLENYQEALNYYKKALKIKKIYSGLLEIGSTLNNIGLVYYDWSYFDKKELLDSANKYLKKASEAYIESNEIVKTPEIYLNIGLIFIKKNEFDSAITYINKSVNSFVKKKDNYGLAVAYYNLGFIQIKEFKNNKALKNLEKSLLYSEKTKSKYLIKDIYLLISNIYKEKKDYKKALNYFEKYSELKDSIFSIETKKEIAWLQNQYEVKKKENLILQQKSDIRKLRLKQSAYIIIINFLIITIVLVVIFFIRKHLKKTKFILKDLEKSKNEIVRKNKIILENIQYASTIQKEIIPLSETFLKEIPNSYIINKPAQIIGGDFLWFYKTSDIFIFAIVDCVGHGVSGSMMAIASNFILNKVIIEEKNYSPEIIIQKLNQIYLEYFKNKDLPYNIVSTMDIGICVLKDNIFEYYGASMPLLKISNNILNYYEGVLTPIGRNKLEISKNTKNHKFIIGPGDTFILFTDGCTDQFGGSNCRPLGKKKFYSFIESVANLPIKIQKNRIERFLENWRNGYEQIDDMLIVGIKF